MTPELQYLYDELRAQSRALAEAREELRLVKRAVIALFVASAALTALLYVRT